MTIQEGNFIIAVFNNWSYKDVEDTERDTTFPLLHNYHEDWNKLMPVVERIELLGYKFQMCRKRVEIIEDNIKDPLHLILKKESSKIDSTWQAVVEFAESYNKQLI